MKRKIVLLSFIALALWVLVPTLALAPPIPEDGIIPTPDGYTPWYSFDTTNLADPVISIPGVGTTAWMLITLTTIAHNPVYYSETSDPSDSILVVGQNWDMANQPPNWSGAYLQLSNLALLKADGSEAQWTWTKSTGNVTRYTVYKRETPLYGACGKPGQPQLIQ